VGGRRPAERFSSSFFASNNIFVELFFQPLVTFPHFNAQMRVVPPAGT
jgi:hypothetical protein